MEHYRLDSITDWKDEVQFTNASHQNAEGLLHVHDTIDTPSEIPHTAVQKNVSFYA
jgi:hypothetical protein